MSKVRLILAMALSVTYKYRQLNPDLAKRKKEAVEVKRKFPDKVPVSSQLAYLYFKQ